MHLRCRNCSQQYYLPESRLGTEPVYFICEQCGDRILVPAPGEEWDEYKPLAGKPLDAGSLLDGVQLSFHFRNSVMSAGMLLAVAVLTGILTAVLRYNIAFFAEHMVLAGLLAMFFGFAVILLSDFNSFIISRNVIRRVRFGYSSDNGEDGEGVAGFMGPLLLLSLALPALYAILVLPLLAMGSAGLVYGGILMIPLLGAGFLFMATMVFKGMLCAFLALRQRSVRGFLSGLARFVAVENINIVIYSVLVSLISLPVMLLIMGLLFGAALIPLVGAGFAAGAGLGTEMFKGMSLTGTQTLMGLITAPESSLSVRLGVSLLLIGGGCVYLLVTGYLVSLVQSLTTTSVLIMASNPAKSVSRKGVLLFLAAFFALAFLILIR